MPFRRDLMFPECTEYGSTFSPSYLTDKVNVDYKSEFRRGRHEYPRYRYSLNFNNVDAEATANIVNLWHTVSGELDGFLFRDLLDFTSGNESVLSAEMITPLDQHVATALGFKFSYPLFKEYVSGVHAKKRRIFFPDEATIRVAVDGYEITSFRYNYSTYELEFVQSIAAKPYSGNCLNGFIEVTGLSVNDLVYVSGFSVADNDRTPGMMPYRVVEVTETGCVIADYMSGAYPANEYDANLSLTSAPPPTGSVITCGFEFFTPVRFDDPDAAMLDAVNGLNETATVNLPSIALIEIDP